MLSYSIHARRTAPRTAEATTKSARLTLDTDPAGRDDAFNPAELLLAAVAACMLKGIERVAPMLEFSFRHAEVHVHGTRNDSPPKMSRIEYELVVESDEPDSRLLLLHRNVRKYGTIYNTVSAAVPLNGTIRRAADAAPLVDPQQTQP
jgi:uncharacterized OsmC-like protein